MNTINENGTERNSTRKAEKANVGTCVMLLLISVISLVLLALLTWLQTEVVNYFTVVDITQIVPSISGVIIATIVMENLGLYFSILFSMIYASIVSSLFKALNKKTLIILNAASFFLVSFIVYLCLILVGQGAIYFFQIFFTLPSNILCVVITQLLLALLFLKKPQHDNRQS